MSDDDQLGFSMGSPAQFVIPNAANGSGVAPIDLGQNYRILAIKCEDCSGIAASTNLSAEVGYEADDTIADLYEQDHRHVMFGTMGMPTPATNNNHYHWAIRDSASLQQDTIGVVAHNHGVTTAPDFFMSHIVCSDAAYAQLLLDVPNIIICGENVVTDNGDGTITIDEVNNATWDGATLTTWQNRATNFGVQLPPKVTNSRRLVLWLLSGLLSRQIESDQSLRQVRMVAV
ncbi:MAG: hypothetical protein L0332_06805 [Chloroflexi bacterium]|nr:hypothetical protein [Chloroflexota bacterium]